MNVLQIITDKYAIKKYPLACKLSSIKGIFLPNKLKKEIKITNLKAKRIIINFLRSCLIYSWIKKNIKKYYKRVCLLKNNNLVLCITNHPFFSKSIISFIKQDDNHLKYFDRYKNFSTNNFNMINLYKIISSGFKIPNEYEKSLPIVQSSYLHSSNNIILFP